jgi:hypothetical protein
MRANVGRLYFAGETTSRKYFGKSLGARNQRGSDYESSGFLQGAYFEGLAIAADCELRKGTAFCGDGALPSDHKCAAV